MPTIIEKIMSVLLENLDIWIEVYELSVLINHTESSIRKSITRAPHLFEKSKNGRNTVYRLSSLNYRPTDLYPEDFI